MTTQESLTRRYRMLCLRCDRAWETAYEIRTLHDDAGDTHSSPQRRSRRSAPTAAASGCASFPTTCPPSRRTDDLRVRVPVTSRPLSGTRRPSGTRGMSSSCAGEAAPKLLGAA